ncbi:DUF5685 family protein [Gordonia sp. ABSL49_1]|uniref:DUF5685 family protein n=1 Tax=Gordonia sp. ABSL49_1 TaxID=2920941 RepID=UPI001F0F75FA|nr:DUF5685 family protein [Gordonia sp. ABSL49_1]MCH5641462.1 DUF5685 family protein [Gordonia sp. ABSL49_1]
MFGLLSPCRHAFDDELMSQWRSHMCGLCVSLRDNHGQAMRLTTNTDAVMVSVLTAAQRVEAPASTEVGRCALRGMRPATVVAASEPGVRLATTTSLTLAAAKAFDVTAEQDHALAPRSRVRSAALRQAGRRLRSSAGADESTAMQLGVDDILETLSHQAEIECDSSELDQITQASGQACAQVFASSAELSGTPANADHLAAIGFDFGRIAHLLDAIDDYESDHESGSFNPLRATDTSRETALAECRTLADAIRTRYAKLTVHDDRLLRVLLLGGLQRAIGRREPRSECRATHHHRIPTAADTQWPPMRPPNYPDDWPYPPPFKPNRKLHERILPFIGVSCFGKACVVDHWNHCSDKWKDAACDDCDCCDCCDCCD